MHAALIHFGILVLAFLLMAIIPGVRLGGVGSAIIAALVFVLVNFFLGWLVKTVLVIGTLGVAFIALNYLTNVVVLWITDKLISGFEIRGFVPLLLAALLLTVANTVSHRVAAGAYVTPRAHQYQF
jgi:putative membrane protein